jgi:hypothetical protein
MSRTESRIFIVHRFGVFLPRGLNIHFFMLAGTTFVCRIKKGSSFISVQHAGREITTSGWQRRSLNTGSAAEDLHHWVVTNRIFLPDNNSAAKKLHPLDRVANRIGLLHHTGLIRFRTTALRQCSSVSTGPMMK